MNISISNSIYQHLKVKIIAIKKARIHIRAFTFDPYKGSIL